MSNSNKDCWKKVIGDRPPSSATGSELRRIEKCTILAAGGNYTGPLKEKRGLTMDSLSRKKDKKIKEIYKSNSGGS